MSFVSAATALVEGAAQDLAGIGSSLADATATVSGPTTGLAAAAQDEVSIALASLFGNFGREFQALSGQAQAFHSQFVNLLNSSAGAYSGAEIANARQTLLDRAGGAVQASPAGPAFGALAGTVTGAPAAASTWLQGVNGLGAGRALAAASSTGLDPMARWQQVVNTTTQNAQTVFGATRQAFNTLNSGVSAGLSELATNPAGFFTNLQTAAQSLTLTGVPQDFATAVTQHTLGVVTQFVPADGSDPIPILDAHNELYAALVGTSDEFNSGGIEAQVLSVIANAAASPLSGVLMGAVGPVVSPGVALLNSAGTVFTDLATGDPMAALAHLVDTPANVVDGFFNGATLNLDPVAPLLNPLVNQGTGGVETLTGLNLGFGGLFSPGQVVDGPGGPMYYGVGGSLFNSFGVHLSYVSDEFTGTLIIPPAPVGPIGAVAGLMDIIGHALDGSLVG